MKEFIVKYLLIDEEIERLKKISEAYRLKGMNFSIEQQFDSIMCCGSKNDIDKKFKFHELCLGLREDYK